MITQHNSGPNKCSQLLVEVAKNYAGQQSEKAAKGDLVDVIASFDGDVKKYQLWARRVLICTNNYHRSCAMQVNSRVLEVGGKRLGIEDISGLIVSAIIGAKDAVWTPAGQKLMLRIREFRTVEQVFDALQETYRVLEQVSDNLQTSLTAKQVNSMNSASSAGSTASENQVLRGQISRLEGIV